MTTISIIPENPGAGETVWRAVAGDKESVGKTVGEALDALTSQLDWEASEALVIVRQLRPDRFFTAEQQQRLAELMSRWRVARDAGSSLPPDEQAELESLIEAEVWGSGQRAEQALRDLEK